MAKDNDEPKAAAKKAQAPDEPTTEPKSPGDLTQEEIDAELLKELRGKVAAVEAPNMILLTPTQAARLLVLAGGESE